MLYVGRVRGSFECNFPSASFLYNREAERYCMHMVRAYIISSELTPRSVGLFEGSGDFDQDLERRLIS